MRQAAETYDVVVCGGGLAGFCAAVAAARHGAKTCLIQDRPVLGGNSSSEVRVTVHGAAQFHAYARESGIISEVLAEERARNHESINENGWTNSVHDMVLYDLAMRTPGLTVHLNTSVVGVEMEGMGGESGVSGQGAVGSASRTTTGEMVHGADRTDSSAYYHRPACNGSRRIAAVVCRVAAAETQLTIRGRIFIDCTGDGIVAHLAGCEWRMGSEGREEFNEPHAPAAASTDTMGNSIHLRARDMGRPCPFTPPPWAVKHENPDYFYKQGRGLYDVHGGFWWIEIGVPWHTIHDAETIRHELTRHALGVWDWMKNRDPQVKARGIDTYALDWIGQVPGKRESRRIIGRYFMTEHDILQRTAFEDEVAFGGWFVDLHTPGGLLADHSEPASAEGYKPDSEYAAKSYCGPYGIPLRMLIAADVDNLGLAGRNVSVTHAALGTVRVMGTCALMGQAIGTAAAMCGAGELAGMAVGPQITRLRQALLRDACFLPGARNEDPDDLARSARPRASSEALLCGVEPDSVGVYGGLQRFAPAGSPRRLTQRCGQLMAVAGTLTAIEVCLTNHSDRPQTVEAELYRVDHIWDYRVAPSEPMARRPLEVPPGALQWVRYPVDAGESSPGFVRLDLLANPDVSWHFGGRIEPGCVAQFQISPTKMRSFTDGQSLAYRLDPPQAAYGAPNVLSGVTRPHAWTNLWRSDPGLPLPQWLELTWESPTTIGTVELTFPGHLLREVHACPPFYRDPQSPRDYTIAVRAGGDQWREIVRVEGNYQRQRRHTLDVPVTTDAIRVTILATNGDPSAAVYEVRCYS